MLRIFGLSAVTHLTKVHAFGNLCYIQWFFGYQWTIVRALTEGKADWSIKIGCTCQIHRTFSSVVCGAILLWRNRNRYSTNATFSQVSPAFYDELVHVTSSKRAHNIHAPFKIIKRIGRRSVETLSCFDDIPLRDSRPHKLAGSREPPGSQRELLNILHYNLF